MPSVDGRLLAHAPYVRALLALAVGLGWLATTALIAGAYLISVVVTGVFLGGDDLARVAPVLVAAAVLAVLRVPLLWLADVAAQAAADRLKGRLRADLSEQLVALGPAFSRRERSGELVGVLIGGMDQIDAYLTSFQPARWLAVAVPLLVIAVIAVIDPPTTLVLILTGPVLVLLLGMIGSRTAASTTRRFAELRWLSAFFLDMLQGIATLKSFGRSAEQVGNIRNISKQYGDTTMEVLRTAFQTSLVLEWGAAVAVALVAVEISLRLMAGAIPFDRALAVLIIVPEFFLPLRQLATRYHAGGAGRTVAVRAFEILDTPRPPSRSVVAAAMAPTAPPEIRLTDVSFTYPERSAPALDGCSLVLPGGRVTALVGPTGAGKTTVTNLLLRFIAPTGGSIDVDGHDLQAIDVDGWRRSLAWVPQRPHVFHGTIEDNLRLARPDASSDDVRRAAADAGVDAFVEPLADGYATHVGEGGLRLSGGQRQRLAIARAFLADAPLVILDEATSHLDAGGEAAIRDALERLAVGRTVLIVSHRLRLAAMAAQVVVLHAGRVVEAGSPSELIDHDGPYRRLVQTQDADGHVP